MSLYGMLFGKNPASSVILATLGNPNVGRLRDAWVETDEGGTPRIAIYTRNGGGNREHWRDEVEEGAECDCPGCIITYRLPQHPLYLFDRDDDFDSTYATVYFSLPAEYAAGLTAMALDEPLDPDDRWQAMIASLEAS